MEKIIIVGAGLHAQCIIAHIEEENKFQIHGLLDLKKTGSLMGYPILGKDDMLSSLKKEGIKHAFPGIALGDKADTSKCRTVYEKIVAAGFTIPSLVSSKAIVRKDVRIGQGVLIQPSAVVDVAAQLGNGVVINPQVLVGHHCRVEDFVVFAGGAVLNGDLTIGEGAFIGMGAKVFNDVGAGSKVAPGAVVMEPVPANHIAFGNPVRLMPKIG